VATTNVIDLDATCDGDRDRQAGVGAGIALR
jgi:hypothetical protein